MAGKPVRPGQPIRREIVFVHVVVALSLALAVLAASAQAQEPPPPADGALGASGEDIVIEFGGGGTVGPAYEGADDYLLSPWPIVAPALSAPAGVRRLRRRAGDRPLVRTLIPLRAGARRRRYSELKGFDDVDAAFEVGATVGYRYGMWRGFGTLRHGFGGHHGLIGEVGADVIVEPTPKLSVSLGPRLHFADATTTWTPISA